MKDRIHSLSTSFIRKGLDRTKTHCLRRYQGVEVTLVSKHRGEVFSKNMSIFPFMIEQGVGLMLL